MKRWICMALATGLFAFTSCSNDDDGGDKTGADCQTCTTSFEGVESQADYCDNGNGTYTVIESNGQETTQDIPDGTNFDNIIADLELTGNCQ
ncbi:hypothetical protein ACFQ3R_03905 [Mesonia ostreae]|uniref:Uncharacterized protein n=1 Tax=Mesonia ostreae TaxID=861110 RepID=A0ABU2KJ14_9FLAO|nr:hypothetical protein [Mesonia ostreae]MDT0294707.1 hypothetical protein [Mesonia ostreae]